VLSWIMVACTELSAGVARTLYIGHLGKYYILQLGLMEPQRESFEQKGGLSRNIPYAVHNKRNSDVRPKKVEARKEQYSSVDIECISVSPMLRTFIPLDSQLDGPRRVRDTRVQIVSIGLPSMHNSSGWNELTFASIDRRESRRRSVSDRNRKRR